MHGVLLLDKPPQLTSHDVVRCVRKCLRTRKVGHAGTLDPFATGLLLVCVGQATRIVEYLVGHPKEYIAEMRLGVVTDTQDYTGKILATHAVHVTEAEILSACQYFRGDLAQIPPMFSARHVQGQRLYELARAGQTVERAASPIHIAVFELEAIRLPEVRFRVVCSAGTYIRTLAHDIGLALGCGAHLTALRRTRVGAFHVAHALPLAALDNFTAAQFISIDDALAEFPAYQLTAECTAFVLHGRAVELPLTAAAHLDDALQPPSDIVRLYDESGRFVALARRTRVALEASSRWHIQPVKVFGDPSELIINSGESGKLSTES